MEKVKFGIIGIGNMGSAHVVNINNLKNCELTAVCDIDPEAFNRIDEGIRSRLQLFTDPEKFLKEAEIDAVMISVPHYSHPDLAILAMRQGKHVIVEKPIAVHKAEAERMIAEAKKYPELKKSAMFNQRTIPAHKKIKQMIDSGELGKIMRVNWIITDWFRSQCYYDSGDWRASWRGEGGGVLLNQGPHQLDLMQWFFGMPCKVRATAKFGKYHDIEVEDDVTAFCEYANGATGVFVTTTGDAKGTNRFEIQLDKAKIVADYNGLSVLEFDISEPEFSKTNTVPFGNVGAHKVELQLDGENPQHDGVIRAWGGAILRGEPLVAHGSEGIYGLTISNAIHLSAWLGKEIDVATLDEELFYSELQKRVATSRRKANVTEQVADTSGTYGSN